MSGNFNGAIDSLVANPVSPFQDNGFGYNYDNVYFPSAAPQLSFNGVLFATTGGEQWNLWGTSPTGYSLHSYTGTGGQEIQGTITSAAARANLSEYSNCFDQIACRGQAIFI
ncbi:MAG: hypothetical protein ABIZ09_12340 [Rhodoferax sp.]